MAGIQIIYGGVNIQKSEDNVCIKETKRFSYKANILQIFKLFYSNYSVSNK